MTEPRHCTAHWVWWTAAASIWPDFYVVDDYGNLMQVDLRRVMYSIHGT